MKTIKLKAFRAAQNGYSLYIGVCKSNELVQFSTVDYYNPELDPVDPLQGYQRPPEKSRISRIGKYLLESKDELLFPTSILLASRNPIKYNQDLKEIEVQLENPLQIIDGQHRVEGIKYALQKKDSEKLHKMDVPFVILETADKLVEMDQFRIINGTAKSVRTDLVNMILTAIYKDTDRRDVPEKEQWKIVVTNVVKQLANDKNSPWYNEIVLPGEGTSKGSSKVMRATSFITSLRPVYIWLKDFIMDVKYTTLEEETEYMYGIVSEYWKALKEVNPVAFVKPEFYVIQKTPGIFSLHKLLKLLLHNMFRGKRDFTKENFEDFLKDSPEITDPNFWSTSNKSNGNPGGPASTYGSMKGFEELFEIISEPYR